MGNDRSSNVTTNLAARLATTTAGGLAALRTFGGLRVLVDGDAVWLRADGAGEALAESLRRIPGAERFELHPGELLVPPEGRVPVGRLPVGPWQPLNDFLELSLSVQMLPPATWPKVSLQLVRSDLPQSAGGILLPFDRWRRFAETAPLARLERLTFATTPAHGTRPSHVLVSGTPLPPLAGRQLYNVQGVWLPLGWTWQPAVDAAVVRKILGLAEPGDMGLWLPDGHWQQLSADDFTRATRLAVRATQEELSRHD